MIQEPAHIKVLLTVEEVAQAMGLGRTFVYELVMRREILSIKLGRKRRIPVTALNDFVARQLSGEA
jgi:excisionase family DNA binding protein